ncbi:LOW QUALITY PROTEIN: hypothetical protein U0070_025186, partial [Myodes glareolus]
IATHSYQLLGGNAKEYYSQRKPEYRVQAGAVQVLAGRAFRKFLWFFDKVLTERSAAETVTKDSVKPLFQEKILQVTVEAVRSGMKAKRGDIQLVGVRVGNKVLLIEYRGTKIVLDNKDYLKFRDVIDLFCKLEGNVIAYALLETPPGGRSAVDVGRIDILMFLGDRFQIQASEGKMRMTKSLHYMN